MQRSSRLWATPYRSAWPRRWCCSLLHATWSERVVGVSLSEFEPGRDVNDRSLQTLMWLVEYLLLARYEK